MSSSPAIVPKPSSGLKNPSYPDRTHFGERSSLEARLKSCDEKLGAVRRKLGLLASHPRRADYEKIYHQLLGARDQFVNASYRMPREAGELYHEDRERLEAAERAFAFIHRRWDAVVS
ncbi:hypothetical protein [Planctomyces sp. SH-PL62]|uniref:hypothetical protein n=1 Tax=Planctomyces sp. SH-PL62 TaxID=1636152 RepID=UPI00078CD2B0|nr:hypothetical protein [Planctomyces sp. SH-PL62]AMV38940.1 hypothetical protein VT85_16005 [Planctomyces sp. SH-PL62]